LAGHALDQHFGAFIEAGYLELDDIKEIDDVEEDFASFTPDEKVRLQSLIEGKPPVLDPASTPGPEKGAEVMYNSAVCIVQFKTSKGILDLKDVGTGETYYGVSPADLSSSATLALSPEHPTAEPCAQEKQETQVSAFHLASLQLEAAGERAPHNQFHSVVLADVLELLNTVDWQRCSAGRSASCPLLPHTTTHLLYTCSHNVMFPTGKCRHAAH
jgi:hypothetical protein